MALTVSALAVALRLHTDPAAAVEEPLLSLLTRQLALANAMVERYAVNAPDEAKEEGAIRLIGYWSEQPYASRGDNFAYAFRNSGAGSILSTWRERRLGVPANEDDE